MRKNWWWFRLVILSFSLVGLGVYLVHATPWRKALGIQPDYTEQIAEGDRLVAAIYAFRAKTTLWPEYLDDLQLPARAYPWFYELQKFEGGHRRPALSINAPAEGGRAHLAYAFEDNISQGAWHVFTRSTDRIERSGPPPGVSVTAPLAAANPSALAAALAELDGRIAREPSFIEHRQDKASLLAFAGRYGDARLVIDAAIKDLPESAWPRAARAQLAFMEAIARSPATQATDVHLGTLPTLTQEYVDWADAHPSLTRCYYTCWQMRQLRDNTRATAAAAQALAQPIEVDPDDTHIAAFYLWDMARFAQEPANWSLMIDICDAWQKADTEGKVKDQSYFALRAAAEIAQGNFPAAQADVERSRHADPAWVNAAGESVRSLSEAIGRHDKNARLTFPPYPGEFGLFTQPE